jgi:ribose transport system substrate-binding protein
MKKTYIFTIFLLLVILLCSCKHKSNDTSKKKLKIAVIPKGSTHVFWKSIHAGAVKAAQELDVEIIWKGPIKEDDRDAQITVVENFITSGVDGIALAPLDETALSRPVMEAARCGIKTVVMDSGLKGKDYVSFVATDNYLGGRKAGDYLAKLLGNKGKVIMLRCIEGSASTGERERGFLDAIKQYANIEVVSSSQYGGATTETAYKASENLLSPFKTSDGKLSIDGIFCSNEGTTFGMLRTLQDWAVAGKVKFVGFDSSDMLVKAMTDGQIDGLVLQDPINMGYTAVKTLVESLRGGQVPALIDTGSTLVTKENMNDPNVLKLLKPDFEKWLQIQ